MFCGNGATAGINVIINKLQIKQIVESVQRRNEFEEKEEEVNEINFCKQNRFGSFDCTLCRVIFASKNAFEVHAQTQVHLERQADFKKAMVTYQELPVIFLSIFEHNSNLLPWRETGAQVEVVRMTKEGDFDYEHLEELLQKYAGRKTLKIGSFCAGSNITGNYFDTDRIAILCHKYDSLAFFDYAGVGPYASINMAGLSGRALYPDEPK